MAASRSLFLMGLLVACICATASAGRVVPVETTSMKLVDVPLLELAIEVEINLDFLPYEDVKILIIGAGGQAVPFTFVDGVVKQVQTIYVAVSISTQPLQVSITLLSISRTVAVPLDALNPVLGNLAAVQGLVQPVKGALTLVKTSAGVVQLVSVSRGVLATLNRP